MTKVKVTSALEKPKRGQGQPAYQPTDAERRLVASASGWGITQEEIALLINDGKGIDADTLRKHFRLEIDRGKAKAHAKMGRTLFQKAMDGDTTMIIWYTKTQMGWREQAPKVPDSDVPVERIIVIREAKKETAG